ncbi:bile acid:sodium symporter family protein [Desulfonatronovibrio hydrogenovorans]|uniref:bile acid:sodium symporter family protein n=1 Tax=Desulfonatronovibrio hydrogenovorans TaxID=53245 RepID=UPI000A01E4BA|nr:bile acid:sodium symporter family protein [Desulfonatronovibrio hydrogenovorans]
MGINKWLKQNWFLVGLLGAAFLAWLTPGLGAAGGALKSEMTTRLGVVLIFFFQGLTLSLAVLKKGVMQWKLHVFAQAFIFLVIPLVALAMILVVGDLLSPDLKLGIFFLGALPTTIATSVAYTAMVKGNVAGSVFNSTVANLAGIFITPLWISLWLQTSGETLPLGRLFLDISLMLLAPLVAGQIIRPLVYQWTDPLKKLFSTLSSLIILFIVYAAFSNSWQQNIWAAHGTGTAVLAAAAAIILFFTVMALVWSGIRLFRFNHENAMSALFCGSQKTLAAGAPMANLIFASQPGLGIILLPLMFYHIIQLFLGGLLVNRINQKAGQED